MKTEKIRKVKPRNTSDPLTMRKLFVRFSHGRFHIGPTCILINCIGEIIFGDNENFNINIKTDLFAYCNNELLITLYCIVYPFTMYR